MRYDVDAFRLYQALMFDRLCTDLEAELEWRRARNLADSVERAANEARIARLDRLIAEARASQPRLLEPASGSPVALIIVLMGYVIVGLLASL